MTYLRQLLWPVSCQVAHRDPGSHPQVALALWMIGCCTPRAICIRAGLYNEIENMPIGTAFAGENRTCESVKK